MEERKNDQFVWGTLLFKGGMKIKIDLTVSISDPSESNIKAITRRITKERDAQCEYK